MTGLLPSRPPHEAADPLYGPRPVGMRDLPFRDDFFRRLLDELYDGVYFVDTSRRILFWNRGAERLTGYAAEEVIGSYCQANILDHTNEKGCHLCHAGCPMVAATRRGRASTARVFLRHKDGRRIAVDASVTPILDDRGEVVGGLEVFRDAGPSVALEQAYVTMREMSLKDPLTGLANRRHLDAMIDLQLDLLGRTGLPFCVVIADLDHFKDVNDALGHAVGDQLLCRAGEILRTGCRRDDVAGRYGGEEFLILTPNQTLPEAIKLAERLRTRLARPPEPTSRIGDRVVTASFGVAECRLDDTRESLLRRVDAAMYRAKQGGRNRVEAESRPPRSL